MVAFKSALARHYKVERDRSEDCLRDIIGILEADPGTESQQIELILERLTRHYDRS